MSTHQNTDCNKVHTTKQIHRMERKSMAYNMTCIHYARWMGKMKCLLIDCHYAWLSFQNKQACNFILVVVEIYIYGIVE